MQKKVKLRTNAQFKNMKDTSVDVRSFRQNGLSPQRIVSQGITKKVEHAQSLHEPVSHLYTLFSTVKSHKN